MTENGKEIKKPKSKKRKTIAGKSIRRMILLGVFIFVATSIAAAIQIFNNNLEDYGQYAVSYVDFVGDNIKADSIPKYISTGQPDDDLTKIRWALMTANNSGLFREVYIVVPTEEDVINISDVYYPETDDVAEYERQKEEYELAFLEHRDYYPGEKEKMMKVYNGEDIRSDRRNMNYHFINGEVLVTVFSPVYEKEDEFNIVGVVGMDLSLDDILKDILRVTLNLLGAIAIIIGVGIAVYYFVLNRTLIKPIKTLQKATAKLIGNLGSDEPFSVDVHTNDEIEVLAESFEEMDKNLKRYIRENTEITADKERLLTELTLAHKIQTSMLPGKFPPFPDRTEFDLFASMDPAKEVGGDFYDFFLIDENHLGLVMADVSGKGVPAALFMMMAKIMIQNLAKAGLGPQEVLTRANEQICETDNEDMFVTVWLGILDITSGVITAVNAGHEYPFLKSPDGVFELVKDKHGLVVGGMPGVPYKEYEMKLEPGSKLFVYTDGLPEATNAENELFGTERSLAALNEVCEKEPEEILKYVKGEADRFVGEAPQFDDLTMLCLVYRGK